jgi:hypothetical protein
MPKKNARRFSTATEALIERAIEYLSKDRRFEPSIAFSYKNLVSESFGILEFIKDVDKENRDIFCKTLEAEGELLDLILVQHLILYYVLIPFSDLQIETYGGWKKESYSFKALRIFTSLLNNACNSLISIKTLTQIGMDIQTRIIFRNYIECMDMGIAILLDEAFFNKYKTDPGSEIKRKQKWQETCPAKIRNTITAAVEKEKVLKEKWKLGLELRKDHYNNSSKAAHADIIAIIYGSYPTIIDTDQTCNGIGGIISNGTRYTLKNIFNYACLVLNFVQPILEDRHSLGKLFKPDSHGGLYNFTKEVNQLVLILSMRKDFQNEYADTKGEE